MSDARDAVMFLYGMEIADTLEAKGLLRPDEFGVEATPTHWIVSITYPPNTTWSNCPYGLRKELKAWGRVTEVTRSHTFSSRSTAMRNANMARNANLDTKVTPMVLLEVKETG